MAFVQTVFRQETSEWVRWPDARLQALGGKVGLGGRPVRTGRTRQNMRGRWGKVTTKVVLCLYVHCSLCMRSGRCSAFELNSTHALPEVLRCQLWQPLPLDLRHVSHVEAGGEEELVEDDAANAP